MAEAPARGISAKVLYHGPTPGVQGASFRRERDARASRMCGHCRDSRIVGSHAPRPLIDRVLTPIPKGRDSRAAGFMLVAQMVPPPDEEITESWGGLHLESLAFHATHRLSRPR